MILFTILLIMLVAIAIVTAILALVGAGSFLIAFGDIIVFGLLVWWIVKKLSKKKTEAQ